MDSWDRLQERRAEEEYDQAIQELKIWKGKYPKAVDPTDPKIYDEQGFPLAEHDNGIPIPPTPRWKNYKDPHTEMKVFEDQYNSALEKYNRWKRQDSAYALAYKRNMQYHHRALVDMEQALLSGGIGSDKITRNTWIADSGASSHMTQCAVVGIDLMDSATNTS